MLTASSLDYRDIVEILTSDSTRFNFSGEDPSKILISAARKGLDEIIAMLLDRRANINAVRWHDTFHDTALAAAAGSGHKVTVF